jgi:ATP-dependent DNA helicase UvrD/PcrA
VVERIFEGLNDEQCAAVEAVRGPVCILAGAGSGKTTTITRRIANQVASDALASDEILAVTFTDKAAREMAARLSALGIRSIRAKTFHAEALAQYRRLSDDASEILAHKGQLLAPIVSRLRPPYRFVALRDIANEIEWAKNRRVGPTEYVSAAGDREMVVPPELLAGVFSSYERTKARGRLMDFEDLLARLVDLLRGDDRSRSIVRSRYSAFTVDEYQDVNLLQQQLLEEWLGDRDEICVVGDDYQSIFGFTGASSSYLLGFPDRYPNCHVVKLTRNYRSTPQVLEIANRLVPKLQGSSKSLAPSRPDGAAPVTREHLTGAQEVEWIVARCRELHEQGLAWEEIAVLHRINGRSEHLEEALSRAAIPYQVRDGAFLRRPAARAVLARLKRLRDVADLAAEVERIVGDLGYRPGEGEAEQQEEATRQADLARMLSLSREYPGDGGAPGFISDLSRRFAAEESGRGVQLLTYHRAKGLEFEAVFLPRLEDKELPFALARTDDEIAEERRLLYVGITRAKRYLFMSWARARDGERRKSPRPSPFLAELGVTAAAAHAVPQRSDNASVNLENEHRELFASLRKWRLERARAEGVPAYVVFNDETLARIASRRPGSRPDLLTISGVGPTKLTRYADDVLALVRRAG